MKKKINLYFISASAVVIVFAIVLSTFISYTLLQKEVYSDLEACAYALSDTEVFDNTENISYDYVSGGFRVTLVDADGIVLYDSEADIEKLSNHADRAEIAEALQKGTGRTLRHSDTLGQDTCYFALLLSNGCVLRVSKNVRSIVSIFLSSLVYLFVGIPILILLSVLCSHFLAKSILAPIAEMAKDMEHADVHAVYKELRPFVQMIQKQHADIVKNANMRQEFTANVSHELKTPLTAISGYSEIMENGMATKKETIRFSKEIHNNANRLLGLINDTIRLSELDGEAQEIQMEALDLYEIAAECVKTLKVKASQMGVMIQLAGKECCLRANREMMRELVYNLCDNAIRYNNKNGSVWVTVGQNEEGYGYLEVKDSGIGIPKEYQERIFERFYRVDKSRSKQTGGTGLGLAIVKHIVVKNHAVLTLESEPGKGTDICVVFPQKSDCQEK